MMMKMLLLCMLGHVSPLFSHFKNAKKFQPYASNSIKGKVGVLEYFSRDQYCKPDCVCSIFSDCCPKRDDIAKRLAHLFALHQNRAIDYYLPGPVFPVEDGYVVKDKEGEV